MFSLLNKTNKLKLMLIIVIIKGISGFKYGEQWTWNPQVIYSMGFFTISKFDRNLSDK